MIQELYEYRDMLLKKEEESYNDEYRNSPWYRKPTLKDVLSDDLYADYTSLEDVLKGGDIGEIKPYVALFEQAAHNHAATWWDDDLGCERTGCEWEARFYVSLRNIAAKTVGLPVVEYRDIFKED